MGVERVALGLDGPDAVTHDRERGAGSFAATRAALAAARDVGLPVEAHTRLTLHTVAHLARTATLVEEFAPALWNVDVVVPMGRGATRRRWGPTRASACSGSSANGTGSEACR